MASWIYSLQSVNIGHALVGNMSAASGKSQMYTYLQSDCGAGAMVWGKEIIKVSLVWGVAEG